MKKLALLILLVSFTFTFSQENYKYIVIPKKFNFFKNANEYSLNEITRSFFVNEGYEVFYSDDELPVELSENRCQALYIDAIEDSKIFVTKIYFEVKDCRNTLMIKSEIGTSREKNFQKAYNESFKESLSSLKGKINFKKNTLNDNELSDSLKVILTKKSATVVANTVNDDSLFIIPTSTGYKLVNDKPEIIFILNRTTDEYIFIAQKKSTFGVLIKKNTSWFFEYYENDKLVSEKVNVKF